MSGTATQAELTSSCSEAGWLPPSREPSWPCPWQILSASDHAASISVICRPFVASRMAKCHQRIREAICLVPLANNRHSKLPIWRPREGCVLHRTLCTGLCSVDCAPCFARRTSFAARCSPHIRPRQAAGNPRLDRASYAPYRRHAADLSAASETGLSLLAPKGIPKASGRHEFTEVNDGLVAKVVGTSRSVPEPIALA